MDTIPAGDNGAAPPPPPPAAATHSSSLEVPLSHSGEIIELDLEEMFSPHQSNQDSIDQLDEVVNMLTRERVKVNVWTRFIQECWTRGRYATALHYADKGLDGTLPSSSLIPSKIRTLTPSQFNSNSFLFTFFPFLSIPSLPPQSVLSPIPLPTRPENSPPIPSHDSPRPPQRSSPPRISTRSRSLSWFEQREDSERGHGERRLLV